MVIAPRPAYGPGMIPMTSPGALAHAATDGTLPRTRERGFSNEIVYNADAWRKSPVIVPHGAERSPWLAAFEPWWEVIARSFSPWTLDFSRLSVGDDPFAGADAPGERMPEAWTRFAGEIRDAANAAGFWIDEGSGRMRVNLSFKLYEDDCRASPRSSYMNLSRDLRLSRLLRPFAVQAFNRLSATSPDWFGPFSEVSFTLMAPRPSACEVFEAGRSLPELARDAEAKLEHDLRRHPPGWGSGKVKCPLPERLYPGWEPLIEDVSYLEGYEETLFGTDPWKPDWVAFQWDWHHGEMSCGMTGEVNAWIATNATGRNRHVYRGIYEFESEVDARAFVARWGDVPADRTFCF